jgi:branched-chain amino acid aminotransferase
MSLLWINGHLIDKADAKVSPFDHGFLYGDGVWEHLRVFGGKPFRLAEHLDSLYAAATGSTFGIDMPLSRDELTAAIEATVKANSRTEAYVRVIVTRGPGTIGPDPRKIDPQVIIIAEEYQPFPPELYHHGLHVVTARHRVDAANPLYRGRTLGRLDWVQAKRHALQNGCLEAVMIHGDRYLVGCTEGGLGFVSDGLVKLVLCHPHEVTGRVVSDLVRELGQEQVGWEPTQINQLFTAGEVFLLGTSCGIIAIVRINDQVIGTGTEGPITRAIRERYHALTRGG